MSTVRLDTSYYKTTEHFTPAAHVCHAHAHAHAQGVYGSGVPRHSGQRLMKSYQCFDIYLTLTFSYRS